MKIGTISVNINTPDFNYGAILHSWAFIKFLNKIGYQDAEVIDYITPHLEKYKKEFGIIEELKKLDFQSARKKYRKMKWYKWRKEKFDEFTKNHIKTSKKRYTQNKLKNSKLDYDAVICESDVIWSPKLTNNILDPSFFLAHENMDKMKKIAYAPSIGDGEFDEVQLNELKEYLKKLDFISTRETYGKTFLENYTDKEVKKVLDPVLLLDEKDFDEITNENTIDKKYILLYLPVNNNNKLKDDAYKYAKEKDYNVIEISTKLQKKNEEKIKVIPDCGVEDFITLTRNAEIIFTNSFHAVCFSIIFKKQFYAFSRKYTKKLIDILEIFDLKDRYFEDDREFTELKEIDYKKVYEKWNKYKNDSIKWIKNALKTQKNRDNTQK